MILLFILSPPRDSQGHNRLPWRPTTNHEPTICFLVRFSYMEPSSAFTGFKYFIQYLKVFSDKSY